ncbi:response regulator transcription factor [Actinoallomurus soli]|uniref:response regulator transcription factor n=1 Tax=Actinoallomurus soli TaxID=2952535 RepID=UPI002092C0BB|nr:response regulator transcription factor [Actinoallomurus soli]MCO5974916.1 response regulator transcription factor [Actinoallomurus soli]
MVRRGLESLLAGSPSARPVVVVAEPAELDPAGPRPDVILLGPSPETEGTLDEVVGKLATLGRVLVVAEFRWRQSVTAVLRAGAHGCVTREAGDDELLGAIATVARGGLHIAPELAGRLHTELRLSPAAEPPALARREVETLRWLAAGLTHRQIARRMALTEATVSTYVKRIRSKLGVGNKADLTRKAFELGLFLEDGETRAAWDPSGP